MMLKRCKCGAEPRIANDNDIAPPDEAWAVYCSELCGEDTHWQCDFEKAAELWNAGETTGETIGGQRSEYSQPKPWPT